MNMAHSLSKAQHKNDNNATTTTSHASKAHTTSQEVKVVHLYAFQMTSTLWYVHVSLSVAEPSCQSRRNVTALLI